MKEETTRWVKVSLITIIMIILIIMPTTDTPKKLGAERMPYDRLPISREVLLPPKIYKLHELPQLYKIHNPQELGAERKASCRANQLVLKSKLEKYKQEYGFYPREKGYLGKILSKIGFWPYHPALTYCPSPPAYK